MTLAPAAQQEKRTVTFQRPHSPFVVDIWEPRHPSGALPVVLVHGWGASGGYWEATAQALSETVQVIVPDLPGTGRSQPVRKAQDMFDQVRSLGAMLDELGLDKVQLVGHSMGSGMSLLLSAKRPEQIERLVMTSMCFFMTEKQKQIYRAVMTISHVTMLFRPKFLADIPGVKRMMASSYFYRVPDDPETLAQGLDDYLNLDYATAVACSNNAADPRIPAAGAAIQSPVLLIACRQDQVMPLENVDYTAETIPDCTVKWIDRCGHIPMVERPREYMRLLNEFLHL